MAVRKVLVVGGGITGSVTAIALAQRNVQVDLVEIANRWYGVGHGITVQGNALRALQQIGVTDDVMRDGVGFDTIRICDADGTLVTTVTTPPMGGADLPPSLGTLRSDLQETLVKAVHDAGVNVMLGTTVARIDNRETAVVATLTNGHEAAYDLIIACDGIRSQTRAMIGIDTTPQRVGMGIWRLVTDRRPGMDCAELSYGGPRYKAGFAPISDDKCYAYLLDEVFDPDASGRSRAEVFRERAAAYGGRWPQIRDGIDDDTVIDYRVIESLLVEGPWHRGRVVVIGDAAHACPPLIAQGAAMCTEDAVILAEMITDSDGDLDTVLTAFAARRAPRIAMVVRNSMQLVDWEIHPDTPGADPAALMAESMAALQEPA
ncbi:FAD-dependent monooxygenase [Gordonia sp. NPDC003424]